MPPRLQEVLDSLKQGTFSPDEPTRFRGLVESLQTYDHFMVAADFDAYWAAQREADTIWQKKEAWWRRSVVNMSGMGWFSSDRTITEYAEEVWGARLEYGREWSND